mmetsp:Transcript_47876/g.89229  ORF Transcript_47876/g.89229 Transcript_47876/m.89229 type:complete len:236 (+) Transcript_47876:1486-2193(+)
MVGGCVVAVKEEEEEGGLSRWLGRRSMEEEDEDESLLATAAHANDSSNPALMKANRATPPLAAGIAIPIPIPAYPGTTIVRRSRAPPPPFPSPPCPCGSQRAISAFPLATASKEPSWENASAPMRWPLCHPITAPHTHDSSTPPSPSSLPSPWPFLLPPPPRSAWCLSCRFDLPPPAAALEDPLDVDSVDFTFHTFRLPSEAPDAAKAWRVGCAARAVTAQDPCGDANRETSFQS